MELGISTVHLEADVRRRFTEVRIQIAALRAREIAPFFVFRKVLELQRKLQRFDEAQGS